MANELDKKNTYWAALPVEDAVAECIAKTSYYYRYITTRGLDYVWLLAYVYAHPATERNALSVSSGEYGELESVRVNEFRGLVDRKANLVKNQRATWEPMAVNNDVDSLAQTKIAKSILEMYVSHKNYDHQFDKMVRYACLYGEAFALQYWDRFKGDVTAKMPSEEVDESTGQPHSQTFYEGDSELRIYSPINVIRDCYIADHDQNHWYIFRDRVNKWDLAAKYPHLKDQILNTSFTREWEGYGWYDSIPYGENNDLVPLYIFVHKPCAALPQGRMIWYCSADCVLESTTLPYDDVPFFRMEDQPIHGYNFSYTSAFDVLQLENLSDRLYSAAVTNESRFAIQNILMPTGSNISPRELMGNMNVIRYDPTQGEPKAMQLLNTSKEVFQMIENLKQEKGQIMGINSTGQGQPPNDVNSGVAISLLQSLNIQAALGLQASYVEAMSYLGTALLNILKKFANTERLLTYVGASNRTLLQKFTSKDIDSVVRVIAKPGNPLTQTIQGKLTLGQMMLQEHLVQTPQELLEVLETGELDSLTQPEEFSLLYIQQENEEMGDGIFCQVAPMDDHVTHIRQHVTLSQDLAVRAGKQSPNPDPQTGKPSLDPNSNPKGQAVMKLVWDHIQEHMSQMQQPMVQQLMAMAWGQGGGQPQPEQPGPQAQHPPAPPKPPGAAPKAPGHENPQTPSVPGAGPQPGQAHPLNQIPQAALQQSGMAQTPKTQ